MGAACGTCRGVPVAPAPSQHDIIAAAVEYPANAAKGQDASSAAGGLQISKAESPAAEPPPVQREDTAHDEAADSGNEAGSPAMEGATGRQHETQSSGQSGYTTAGSLGAKSAGSMMQLGNTSDLIARRAVSMKKVGFEHEKLSPFKSKYKVGKTLGKGAFSSVKLVTQRDTKDKYAVKIVNVGVGSPARIEDVRRELEILQSLDHQKIMRCIEAFEEGDKVYIVSEILPGGELLNSLLEKGTYTEEDAQMCFRQLLKALSYIHGQGIIHRDLKLENLLLKHPKQVSSVKLIDFGMAKYASTPETKKTVIGTPLYVAPEILAGDTLNPYDYPGDMWSAGVVLHILLVGFPPFFDDAEPTLFQLIKKCQYTFDDPAWNSVSEEAKDLVSNLLTLSPADRFSADQALDHKFCRSKGSEVCLVDAVDNMRGMMNRKLKGAVKSMMALSRMSMVSKMSMASSGKSMGALDLFDSHKVSKEDDADDDSDDAIDADPEFDAIDADPESDAIDADPVPAASAVETEPKPV